MCLILKSKQNNNHMYKSIILTLSLLFLCPFFITTYSQTYATEELRVQAEKEDAEKRQRLGIKEEKPDSSSQMKSSEHFPLEVYIPMASHFKTTRIEPLYLIEKVSKTQRESSEREVKREFQKDNLVLDFENNQLLIVRKETQEIYRSFSFTLSDQQITLQCKCEIPSFIIKERNANRIIIEIPNQDQNAIFNFIYILENED